MAMIDRTPIKSLNLAVRYDMAELPWSRALAQLSGGLARPDATCFLGTVDGDALIAPYSAPGAGPPPWHLYRFAFHTVTGTALEAPHGATRWHFAA